MLEVSAFTPDGEHLVTTWPIIDRWPASEITVAAGESLEGELDLGLRLPDLARLRRRNDVIVSWAYTSPFTGSDERRCFSGVALFTRLPG
jgi:hypothetical protein